MFNFSPHTSEGLYSFEDYVIMRMIIGEYEDETSKDHLQK